MSYFDGGSDDDNESYGGSDSDDSISDNEKPPKPMVGGLSDDELEGGDISENGSQYGGSEYDSEYSGGASDTEDEYKDLEDDKNEGMEEKGEKQSKKSKESKESKKTSKTSKIIDYEDNDSDDDDDDYEDESYLQKFNKGINENYILNNHPECVVHNYNEVLSMCSTIKDANGIIIDDLHRTVPYLTKYERARILGVRAKQINSGGVPLIKLPEGIIDGYIIAEMELKEKKIPFIIRRPMPNGGSEYWFLKDLEDLSF